MSQDWIAVRDLKPGDRIKVIEPPNAGRVIKCRPHDGRPVMITQHGRMEHQAGAVQAAWLIDFEYLNGALRGRTAYAWQHPDDRIFTA